MWCYGGNPAVLGTPLVFDGKPYSVIGVAPPGLRLYGYVADVFTPLGQITEKAMQNREAHRGLNVFARLRPGVALAEARAELALIGQRLAAHYPKSNAGRSEVEPGRALAPRSGFFNRLSTQHNSYNLLRRLGCQRFYDGNVRNEFLRQVMPGLKVSQAIVRDPDFTVAVLPNQNLERQIDRDAGRRNHQRRSGFRTAEYQKLGGPHLHSGFFCFTAVIDHGKQLYALGLEYLLDLLNRLIDQLFAGYADDSVICNGCHGFLLTISEICLVRFTN